MKWLLGRIVVLASVCVWAFPVFALQISSHEQIQSVARKLEADGYYTRQQLEDIFSGVTLNPKIIAAMKKPAERLPWHRYRRFFVSDGNARVGARFWVDHEEALARAEQEYGVPAEIIVAIIGVETRFGTTLGKNRVLESLTTLAVDFPRRSKFFLTELENFLVLCREEGLDPTAVKGSYAGAMGVPQFIASSYRHYAVDFNRDGRRDLIGQVEDAIGSVANYLEKNGWKARQPVTIRASGGVGDGINGLVETKLKTAAPLKHYIDSGITISTAYSDALPTSLIRLDGESGNEYFVAFENFYVITRYNRSTLYAMAVAQLSESISKWFPGTG